MNATVIAAIDNNAAAEPVLQAALGLADHLEADVEALHVVREGQQTALSVAERMEVPVRIVSGPPARAILEALTGEEVVLGVIGARGTRGGARPVAPIALEVLEQATKPVAVVPPEAFGAPRRHIRRILVPLNGSEEAADAVRPLVDRLTDEETEVIVLHVFDETTTPQFLDHRHRDLDSLATEFLAHHWAGSQGRLEWGSGDPAANILERARGDDTDLVVMSWRQHLVTARGEVVHGVLSASKVPVILLPLVPDPDPRGVCGASLLVQR